LGARTVDDLQVEPFAGNAIVVLHGCQIGAGEHSFAEQMLRHLVGDRPNVRIFAHSESGVCGRTRDWIEFNRHFPDGRRRSINPFHREDRVQRTALDEEQRLQNPIAAGFVQGGSLATLPDQMMQALEHIPSLGSAEAVVQWWGHRLWKQARHRAQEQGDTDDRPLYWTRLRMRQLIRDFSPSQQFSISSAQREQLVQTFTYASRGMPTGQGRLAWIPQVKKILISGFDPFQLDADISRSNPAGAAALALDGQIVSHPHHADRRGQIQAVILPVVFDFFDRGHIEHVFSPYISGDSQVDMVLTISQGRDNFELEEYASRYRHPNKLDNELAMGGTANLPPGAEFNQSTLPRAAMHRDVLGRSEPLASELEFQGIYQGSNVAGPSETHPTPERLTQARSGSGGDYLSNEIFYRTTLIRDASADEHRRTLPMGHLHIPQIQSLADEQGISFHGARNQIIDTVRRLIIAALPEL
jgi:pyrrolidone-carboxylate peptidase